MEARKGPGMWDCFEYILKRYSRMTEAREQKSNEVTSMAIGREFEPEEVKETNKQNAS